MRIARPADTVAVANLNGAMLLIDGEGHFVAGGKDGDVGFAAQRSCVASHLLRLTLAPRSRGVCSGKYCVALLAYRCRGDDVLALVGYADRSAPNRFRGWCARSYDRIVVVRHGRAGLFVRKCQWLAAGPVVRAAFVSQRRAMFRLERLRRRGRHSLAGGHDDCGSLDRFYFFG